MAASFAAWLIVPWDQQPGQAFADIAHALGKKAVAEAVEDDATFRLLRVYGVVCAQGHHIRPPGPAADVLDAELAPGPAILAAG